jgi:hypothetical protein
MPVDTVRAAEDLMEITGPFIEPDERKAAYDTLVARYTEKVDGFIANNAAFAEAGVKDYEDYKALSRKAQFRDYQAGPEMYVDTAGEKGNSSVSVSTDESGGAIFITGEGEDGAGPFVYDPETDYTLTAPEQYIMDDFMGELIGYFNLRMDFLHMMIGGEIPKDIPASEDAGGSVYDTIAKNYEPDGEPYRTDAQTARIREMLATGEVYGVLPEIVVHSVSDMMIPLMALILVLTAFLLTPIITGDRMTGVQALQFSSKAGRRVLTAQLGAMLIATLVVTTIALVCAGGVMYFLGWQHFVDTSINSFMTEYMGRFWFKGTFGQYLLCMAGLAYVLAFAHAFVCFLISKQSRQYISMLLALVPWVALFAVFLYFLLNNPFAFMSSDMSVGSVIGIPYIEVWIGAALLVGSFLIATRSLKESRRRDVPY